MDFREKVFQEMIETMGWALSSFQVIVKVSEEGPLKWK